MINHFFHACTIISYSQNNELTDLNKLKSYRSNSSNAVVFSFPKNKKGLLSAAVRG